MFAMEKNIKLHMSINFWLCFFGYLLNETIFVLEISQPLRKTETVYTTYMYTCYRCCAEFMRVSCHIGNEN